MPKYRIMDQQTMQRYGSLVASWASPSPRDHDTKWGLLLGTAATNNSTSLNSIPLEIWSEATLRMSNIVAIHVTSSLKAAEINEARQTETYRQHLEGTCHDQQLITHSYGSLLKAFRGNTVPFDGSMPYD